MPALYDAAAGGANAKAAMTASSATNPGRQGRIVHLFGSPPARLETEPRKPVANRHSSGTNASHTCARLRATFDLSPGGRGFGMGPARARAQAFSFSRSRSLTTWGFALPPVS